jgi:hypothetical protein
MKNFLFCILITLQVLSCRQVQEKKEQSALSEIKETGTIDQEDVDFSHYFMDKTMRLDFFHSGTAAEEHFSVDRIVSDGIWSGSKKSLEDKLGLGLYFFQVIDSRTRVLLYSRGFADIFGEWQTIPEAKEKWGTFNESVRFPWPLKPVTFILKKRNNQGIFATVWTIDIDPSSGAVNSTDLIHTNKVDIITENGPAERKVDLVILGDGYSHGEMEKFRKDSKRLTEVLFSVEPFSSHSGDFNVRAIETPSESSGVSKPHQGIFRRTPLSVHYGSFDSERYALTYDNRTIRDVASQVPYDLMVILINERTYGGGGIYNLYTTVAAGNKFSDNIMVHEIGHHLAALADEYYTSSVSYEAAGIITEPWEPNITALHDRDKLKWKDLVEKTTPIPTPWNKEEFDRSGYQIQKTRDSLRAAMVPENLVEDLFIRQNGIENEYFEKERYRDAVGAFEGAAYMARGLYRPQLDCIMYTRHMHFCKVCKRSIEKIIDQNIR